MPQLLPFFLSVPDIYCVRFTLRLKLSLRSPLELVWHRIQWLCVEEERSFQWRMCAIINGLFLVLTRFWSYCVYFNEDPLHLPDIAILT